MKTYYAIKNGRKFVTFCNGDGYHVRLFERKSDADSERCGYDRVVKVAISEVQP